MFINQNRILSPAKPWGVEFTNTDNYIEASSQTLINNLSNTSSYTFEAYFKWYGGGGGDAERPFIVESYPNWSIGLGLRLGDVMEMNFFVRNNEDSSAQLVFEKEFQTNTWYHIAVCFEQGSANEAQMMYINGELEASQGTSDEDTSSLSETTGDIEGINIGTYRDFDDRWWNGVLSDIRFWDHKRSEKQIKDYMNYRLTGREPGLFAYWPMIEGQGNEINDWSLNKTTGDFINGPNWVRG